MIRWFWFANDLPLFPGSAVSGNILTCQGITFSFPETSAEAGSVFRCRISQLSFRKQALLLPSDFSRRKNMFQPDYGNLEYAARRSEPMDPYTTAANVCGSAAVPGWRSMLPSRPALPDMTDILIWKGSTVPAQCIRFWTERWDCPAGSIETG